MDSDHNFVVMLAPDCITPPVLHLRPNLRSDPRTGLLHTMFAMLSQGIANTVQTNFTLLPD